MSVTACGDCRSEGCKNIEESFDDTACGDCRSEGCMNIEESFDEVVASSSKTTLCHPSLCFQLYLFYAKILNVA